MVCSVTPKMLVFVEILPTSFAHVLIVLVPMCSTQRVSFRVYFALQIFIIILVAQLQAWWVALLSEIFQELIITRDGGVIGNHEDVIQVPGESHL